MSDKTITRRQFIAGAGAAVASLPLLGMDKVWAAEQQRPNFVFILIDDLRYDRLSCTGNPFQFTPNIDRIGKEGAIFTNMFVTISLCSPSRACFLTGRYAHSHGVMNNVTPFSDDLQTFPRALHEAGYDTAFMGKWHMGSQEGPRPGFDRWVSFKGQGVYMNPMLNIDGKQQEVGGYITDLLTDYAVDWLKQPRTAPFCLYLSHKATHGPFTPAARHAKLFENLEVQPPVNAAVAKGAPTWLADVGVTAHGSQSQEKIRERVIQMAQTLQAVDDSVGSVLRTLEQLGQLDNTVIVFAGDNGYYLGEHGLFDKRSMHEESIRIPFLMRYPKMIKPGTKVDGQLLNIDLCPTFIDLAGARVPDGVQGKSFVPILKGRTKNVREDWLYEYFKEQSYVTPTMRGVRTDRWKYVEYPDLGSAELYDLTNDKGEMVNLVADPRYAKVLADMKNRLARLMKETGADKVAAPPVK